METYAAALADLPVLKAPENGTLDSQVEQLEADIEALCSQFPGSRPVLVNLLPAAAGLEPDAVTDSASLYQAYDPEKLPGN